jgi:hypothetical protein
MSGVQEVSMADSHESKLDTVLKSIEVLTARIGALENFALEVGISQGAEIPQPVQYIAVEGPIPLPSQITIVPTKTSIVVLHTLENQGSASREV